MVFNLKTQTLVSKEIHEEIYQDAIQKKGISYTSKMAQQLA